MTLAQRLKRVFHIDVETCERCGSVVKMIACIEYPVLLTGLSTTSSVSDSAQIAYSLNRRYC